MHDRYKLAHKLLALYCVLSNLIDLCRDDYHAPKIKITYTHTNLPFLHWECTQACLSIHKNVLTPTLGGNKKRVLVGIIALKVL